MRIFHAVRIFAWWLVCLPVCMAAGGPSEVFPRKEYSYRRYTSHDGLHHMMLDNLMQDSLGFIWIGTYKGFARFDGFRFTPFLSETMENILRIEDAGGGAVRAFSQTCCYTVSRNDSLRTATLTDSLTLNSYNSSLLPPGWLIYQNPSSRHKYLMRLDGDSLREVLYAPELDLTRNNRLWMDTVAGVLYMPAVRSLAVRELKSGKTTQIAMPEIESFLDHSRFGLLAIGKEGIYKVRGTELDLWVPYRFGMLNKQMLETADGGILIRDFLSLYRLRDGRVDMLRHDPDLPMWDMRLDREGNLWVATGNGLYNFFRFDFLNYYFDGHSIKSVVRDKAGAYWFAGLNEELFRMADGRAVRTKYPMPSFLSTTSFSYGSGAVGGEVFFPRRNGVLVQGGGRYRWAGLPVDYSYKRVIPYRGGVAYAAHEAVLVADAAGKIVKTLTEAELGQENIYDIAVDGRGRLIACGERGLSIIGERAVTGGDGVKLTSGPNTADNFVMAADSAGRIWSASANRLNLLTESDSVATVHRFPGNVVVGLRDAGGGQLLIAMLRGFYLMDVEGYFRTGEVQLLYYDHNNGMIGLEPVINALYIDSDGRAWMPTTECVVSFEPRKLVHGVSAPALVVQGCEVSPDNVRWERFDGGTGAAFGYRSRNFRFSFIGLNYSAGANVRYAYRLRGFQEEWSAPGGNRQAVFNNLPPGDYVFELYADSGTDSSRSAVQSLAFTIRPALWQRAWFRVIAVLLLAGAVAGAAIGFQRRRTRRQMERLRTEKTLNDLRIRSIRLKAIPHFNSNVLSAIEYFVMTKPKEEANRLLNVYSRFTGLTLREVDRASRSLKEEVEYATLYLQLEKLRFTGKFDYRIEIGPGVDEQVQLPNMILHTYCENAVKHGFSAIASGGMLTVSARHLGNSVEITVEDNGIGRKAAAARNTHGTRQGLEILTRQIEIYNSFNERKIVQTVTDLYDAQGKPAGTRVTVEIPYGFIYG